VLFLTDRQGVPATAAGSLLSGALLAAALGRVAWGLIADRFFSHHRSGALALVMALTALAAAALALLSPTASPALAGLIGLLYGFCAMGWQGLLMVVIAESVGIALAGTAVGLLINVAWGGFVLGPIAFGALADGPGYDCAWGSVAAVAALCALALWRPPALSPAAV
jgi:MFS family permease